jgi:hypothetical protein
VNAGVAQLVERNLAKVEVESSRLFSRSSFKREADMASFFIDRRAARCARLQDAGVAQLVERNLAKVEVESSRLFSRSRCMNVTAGFCFVGYAVTIRSAAG